MKTIAFADKTIRETANDRSFSLSFREKTEMAKVLDSLNVSVIELPPVINDKTDTLLYKTIASVVKNSAVSVRTGFSEESVETAYNSIKAAKKPIITVCVPVSSVQMEYICNKKPPKVLEMTTALVKKAKSLCCTVEFSAGDATRGEREFLYSVITAAVEAGADKVTVCDDAGNMMPDEFGAFIKSLRDNIPALENVTLCAEIADNLDMATANTLEAVKNGADEIKTAVGVPGSVQLINAVNVIKAKGDDYGFNTQINTTKIGHAVNKLTWITDTNKSEHSPFENGVNDNAQAVSLDKTDDLSSVSKAVEMIGYDLSEEDNKKVYDAFVRVASKKDIVTSKELEAIVASVAMQVPSTYHLVSYVINSGNIITATANICIEKNGKKLNGVYVGDGPIDAAFLAIEQIIGHHYELDDFQIQAVTEGREAVGSSLVKLRSDSGKLYSGNGISTDVIGAAIRAYMSAFNKIAYEEN